MVLLLAGGLVDALDGPPAPAVDVAGAVVLEVEVPAVPVAFIAPGVELELLVHAHVCMLAMSSTSGQLVLRNVIAVSLTGRTGALAAARFASCIRHAT